MKYSNIFTSLLLCLLILTFFINNSSLLGQETTGRITGFVKSAKDEPLPGANIIISGNNLQGTRGTVSDDRGTFNFHLLPIGEYDLRITYIGFREIIIENLVVRLGATTFVGDLTLEKGNVGLPEILVQAGLNPIDPVSTEFGGNLDSGEFDRLPAGRDYAEMIQVLPHAAQSYLLHDGINISGSTGHENKYFIDGVDVSDPYLGVSWTTLPYNFIKEVQLLAGGYDASLISSLGGTVNAVTNSGTNTFQGSVFGFYTGNSFSSKRKLGVGDREHGDYNDYDFGFGLGGPVIIDQVWFYLAYNPKFFNQDVDIPSYSESVDRVVTHPFALKFDWAAAEKISFSLTLTGDPYFRRAVGLNVKVPPKNLLNEDVYLDKFQNIGYNLSLSGKYFISENLFLNAAFDKIIRDINKEPETARGKSEIHFRDLTTGTWGGGPENKFWSRLEMSDVYRMNINYKISEHFISGGASIKKNFMHHEYDGGSIYKYSDTLYHFYHRSGKGDFESEVYSFYLNDQWQITEAFSLYGGIRIDKQNLIGPNGKIVQSIEPTYQPRGGFAFLFGEKGSQKIYGSAGRYAQELTLRVILEKYNNTKQDFSSYYDHDPRLDGALPDSFSRKSDINPETKNLEGQYSDEFSLGYQILFWDHYKFGIQGLYRTLRSAVEDVMNFDAWRFDVGNPGKGLLKDWPAAKREYTALILMLESYAFTNFNFRASYVLSRNYGNYAGLYDNFTRTLYSNQNRDFDDMKTAKENMTGLLPNDRTHIFKFSGSYNFFDDLDAGIIFSAQSGTPLSVAATTVFSGIKMLEPRGSAGRTDFTWDLSARVQYYLKSLGYENSKIFIDAYHIFSQRKAVDIDQLKYNGLDENGSPISPNPTYGQAYYYQPPMSVRFGVEVDF